MDHATDLKILMVCGDYLPFSVGGTEIFCQSLAAELKTMGVTVSVAVHNDRAPNQYEVDGVRVRGLPALKFDPQSFTYKFRVDLPREYGEFLLSSAPDVVHFHSWNGNLSLDHLELTKSLGYPVLITQHVPGMTCLQRSLLFRGREPCDGEIRVSRCTRCRAAAFGQLPRPLDMLVGYLALPNVRGVVSQKVARILNARQDTAQFKEAVRACISTVDAVHVLTEWSREVLLRNGAPSEKIRLIRTGLPRRSAAFQRGHDNEARQARPLRLVYWGRLDWTKGVHILCDAMRRVKSKDVELLLYGAGGDVEYLRWLEDKVREDSRIRLMGPVAPEHIPEILLMADIGVIPSLWFETGPLTVLEAQAAGLPIIGSRIGGIAELCTDGIGARLCAAGNSKEFASVIQECVDRPDELRKLRATVPEPRRMTQVAKEILLVYNELHERNVAQCGTSATN